MINITIGIIDSGLGAISVLNALIKQKKYANYILFLDYAYNPYGTKDEAKLLNRLSYAILFLKKRSCDKIIIACNTLSLIAIKYNLKDVIIPPLYFKKWLKNFDFNSSILLATNYTIKSNYYEVKGRKSSDLVNYIEGKGNKLTANISKYKYLYLGCTHFNLLKNKLKKHIIFDSGICLANNVIIDDQESLKVTIYLSKINQNIINHILFHLHLNKYKIIPLK